MTYVEQETGKAGQLNSYSQVMRNNEELLASHLRVNTKAGDSRDNSESSDNDTSQLVTSQVSVLAGQMAVRNSPLTAVSLLVFYSPKFMTNSIIPYLGTQSGANITDIKFSVWKK